MKTSIYAALLAIVATSTSVIPASATTAESCLSTPQPATTGGAIRQQLEMMARCKTENQPSTNLSTQQPTTLPVVKSINVNGSNSNTDTSTQNGCRTVPLAGVTGGAIRQQLEALQKCGM
jgi:hypothetical protein